MSRDQPPKVLAMILASTTLSHIADLEMQRIADENDFSMLGKRSWSFSNKFGFDFVCAVDAKKKVGSLLVSTALRINHCELGAAARNLRAHLRLDEIRIGPRGKKKSGTVFCTGYNSNESGGFAFEARQLKGRLSALGQRFAHDRERYFINIDSAKSLFAYIRTYENLAHGSGNVIAGGPSMRLTQLFLMSIFQTGEEFDRTSRSINSDLEKRAAGYLKGKKAAGLLPND